MWFLGATNSDYLPQVWSFGNSSVDKSGPTNWVEAEGLNVDGPGATTLQYVTSLYWAVTTLTTVGYGDIHAISTGEKMFSLLTIIIGSVLYATVFGELD